MISDNQVTEAAYQLSPRIRLLPVRHGSGDVAQEVREYLLTEPVDCLAIPLPPSVEEPVETAITHLPHIQLVLLPETQEHVMYSSIPIDPCQAVIMGIRVALNEDIPRAYIDREVMVYEPTTYPTADPYALKHVSFASYSAAMLPSLPAPVSGTQRWQRIAWMAFRLHELELYYESILCLCSLDDWPWIRTTYHNRATYETPDTQQGRPESYSVQAESLYFVLGELPFVTELYETRRQEARSDTHLSIDGIKELLLETRTHWLRTWHANSTQESNWVTPQLLQMYLQYVRNLSLLHRRLTPDLYTLVLAAKQLAGDEFALTLLDTAKQYRFQEGIAPSWSHPLISAGLGEVQFPDGTVAKVKNRLTGELLEWKSLSLRPAPPKQKTRKWAFQWNPFGQCSWPPEDEKIESFSAHVRQQTKSLLGAELAKAEKFTTSLRDGIDVRETLRHSMTSTSRNLDIYVKDIPPSRGTLEVIVFLFEIPADTEKFTWQATWYAEHAEESTLCFFATPFLDNMVGPGIGQSQYGGTMFLFPPRPIPDIWTDPQLDFTRTLEERLLAGACRHSQEPYIALVSPVPPKARWRQIARKFGRKLIPIPLSRFSGQTVNRLRRFHVLNGHDIRSYASQFIRE
ncbi:MAG: hypothetical protein NPIRA02_09920 [Nitrospirales bacterium]|nr:MAG: hypothetical protein NPIRA02_09920 [Nitrospirales bacterium]